MRVGVLKPDHLGDLILAAPAIAALQRRFSDLTLFCHPKNVLLAGHLFPQLRSIPIFLPHLNKDRSLASNAAGQLRTLGKEIDLLICLRWDGQCEQLLSIPEIEVHAPGPADSPYHVAVDHRRLVMPFTGPYDLLETYRHPACPPLPSRPRQVGAVGLCISSGFPLNAWPMNHWLELAKHLHRHNMEIVLIGGPAEAGRLLLLEQALQRALGHLPRCIVGTDDFQTTLEALAHEVDLVIATDSGTAHLAALVRPVISLFGGSPWRRFAPLGRFNMILSRRTWCSPCIQFNRTITNTCHTQECLSNLRPDQVYACLTAYLAGIDLSEERRIQDLWMTQAPWSQPITVAA